MSLIHLDSFLLSVIEFPKMSKRSAQPSSEVAAKSLRQTDAVSDMVLKRAAVHYTGDMKLSEELSSIFVVGQLAALKAFSCTAPDCLKQELSDFVSAHEDGSSG